MPLFPRSSPPSPRVPLSNYQLQQQILTARSEQLRARHIQHSGREAWFTMQMDAALDVLAERLRSRWGPARANRSG